MTTGDLDGAYSDYLTILEEAPSNAEANLGAALIEVMNVAVDDNTRALGSRFNVTIPTSLNELVNSLTITSTSATTSVLNAASFTYSATTSAITPSEIQEYIAETLIPALDRALTRLTIVEQDEDFQLIVAGTRSNTELDLGEVYLLDLIGSSIKGMLHEAISYNWDYNTATPQNEPDFATLKSDGGANMAAAKTAYIRMLDRWIAGINFIDAETDDQTNDAIPKFNRAEDKELLLDYLGLVEDSFVTGATGFEISDSKSIVIDLKSYYDSPVADWKVFYNTAVNTPEAFDYTVNGLFPDLETYEDWQTLVL